MADRLTDPVVRCRFDGCDAALIVRVALAVVDQLAAADDADISVLDALDYPLTDGIEALHDRGIESVEVSQSGGVVRIDVHVERAPLDVGDAFADAQDAVETFFEVSFPEGSTVRLAGSLR